MTVGSFEFQPKIPRKAFLLPSLKIPSFCYCCCCVFFNETLQFTNLTILISNTQMKHFCAKYKQFLFLHETLQQEKFEGVDSKYDHRFFKFLSKNNQ